jgi:hypothetical protein
VRQPALRRPRRDLHRIEIRAMATGVPPPGTWRPLARQRGGTLIETPASGPHRLMRANHPTQKRTPDDLPVPMRIAGSDMMAVMPGRRLDGPTLLWSRALCATDPADLSGARQADAAGPADQARCRAAVGGLSVRRLPEPSVVCAAVVGCPGAGGGPVQARPSAPSSRCLPGVVVRAQAHSSTGAQCLAQRRNHLVPAEAVRAGVVYRLHERARSRPGPTPLTWASWPVILAWPHGM